MKKLLLIFLLVSVTIGYSQNSNGQGKKKKDTTTTSMEESRIESVIDPGGGGAYTWWRDHDLDGYGDPNFSTDSDTQPYGYAPNDDDCNDYDADVNPGETEALDGKDNDCDGQIDEGLNAPSMPSTPLKTQYCGYTRLTRGTPPSGVTWYWESSSNGTSTSNSSVSIDRYSGTVYYLRARDNSNGLWSTSRSINYTIDNCTATAPSDESFEAGLGDWTQDSSDDMNWTRKSGSTGSSGTGPTSAEDGSYYLYTEASGYTTKTARITSGTYNISQNQSIVFSYHMYGSAMGTLRLEVSANGGTTWTSLWTLSGNQENAWKTATVGLSAYLDSDIKIRFTGVTGSSYTSDISIDHIRFVTAGSCNNTVLSNENYVYTRVYNEAMSTSPASPDRDQVIEEITYFDGLGRPMQHVGIGQAGGIQYEDIVTTIPYDSFGRQTREYLPVPMEDCNPGAFRTGDMDYKAREYYDTKFVDDFSGIGSANPYSESQLEASPISRPEKQTAPGYDWRLGGGHEIEMDYQTNATSEVRYFYVSFSSGDTKAPILSGGGSYYNPGELYKTVTYDENNSNKAKAHSVEEFKDKQGRVILKRTYTGTTAHDTYYVYDDYGNLTYVLPPKVIHDSYISTAEKNELCYQYKYDHRNRLIEKKLPGKGWEYIVYNNLDQPALTQDQNLKVQNKWLFTKYDPFGRVAYTGYISNSNVRSTLQGTFDGATDNYEERQSAAISMGGTSVYYTNDAKPQTTISEIYTINYYDSYDNLDTGFTIPTSNGLGETIVKGVGTKGLATVTKTKVLGTSQWIITATGYDAKGRVVWVKIYNPYLGTTDIVSHDLDFTGVITQTKTTHQKTGKSDIVTIDNYEYDHMKRLTKHTQTINGGSQEVIAENTYDELGQLVGKGVGNADGSSRLQNMAFEYNVRGWLKQINDVGTTNKLFNFKLSYNDPSSGTALYNGNISRTDWRTDNTDSNLKYYRYYYDDLNRITSATANSSNYNVSGITYDKNGNILSLTRKGAINSGATSFGSMDVLSYGYNSYSNRLKTVNDSGNDTYGFKDGSSTTTQYSYDTNGNLTSDLNKGISAGGIEYNHLNMPTKVTVSNAGSNNGVIDYVYTADGIKLQKKKTQGGVTTTTDYAGDFVYENNTLKQFYQPEGYVEPDGSGWQYVYQYKDIWGNTRITYADDDNSGSINSSEIRREQNYYPFGLEHKGYNINSYGAKNNLKTYQGQEFTEDLGLNTHEWKYRMSDPAIGRFWQVDPLAEDYMYNSTYAFQENKMGMGVELEGLELYKFPNPIQSIGNSIASSINRKVSSFKRKVNNFGEKISSTLSSLDNFQQKDGYTFTGKAEGIGDKSGMFPEAKGAKSSGTYDVQVLVDIAESHGPDLPAPAEGADIFSSLIQVINEDSNTTKTGDAGSTNETSSKTKQAPFSYFLRSFQDGKLTNVENVKGNGKQSAQNTLRNDSNLDSVQIMPFYILEQGSKSNYEREKDTTVIQ